MASLRTESMITTLTLAAVLPLVGCQGPGEKVSLGSNHGAGNGGQAQTGGQGQGAQAAHAGQSQSESGGSTTGGSPSETGGKASAGAPGAGGSGAQGPVTGGAGSGGRSTGGTSISSGGAQLGGAQPGGAGPAGAPGTGAQSATGGAPQEGGTGGMTSGGVAGSPNGGAAGGGSGGHAPGCSGVPTDIVLCHDPYTVYYFDPDLGSCRGYTGCPDPNVFFHSLEECEGTCGGPSICTLPLDNSGTCDANLSRYYFDPHTQTCVPFQYNGCDGNANNFASLQACESACVRAPCAAPPRAEGCDLAVMSYYFDAITGTCEPYSSGYCGAGPNSFSSQSECEQTCVPSCVVGVSARLPCCSQGTPVWSTEVAADPALMAYPAFGFPEECSLVDCWISNLPSRVAQRSEGSSNDCEFADECLTEDDCVKVINHGSCCSCPMPSPEALLGTNPCVVPVGEPPGPGCVQPDCDETCGTCPESELVCDRSATYGSCSLRRIP